MSLKVAPLIRWNLWIKDPPSKTWYSGAGCCLAFRLCGAASVVYAIASDSCGLIASRRNPCLSNREVGYVDSSCFKRSQLLLLATISRRWKRSCGSTTTSPPSQTQPFVPYVPLDPSFETRTGRHLDLPVSLIWHFQQLLPCTDYKHYQLWFLLQCCAVHHFRKGAVILKILASVRSCIDSFTSAQTGCANSHQVLWDSSILRPRVKPPVVLTVLIKDCSITRSVGRPAQNMSLHRTT